MKDRFGRTIEYLRVSVTDRCNLRCQYCMPEEGVSFLPHERILSYEEITDVVKTAVQLGVWKVRITGGEPLVRRDITKLVEMLAAISGIRDLAMTSNGLLLDRFASELTQAGLQRVNISLDTVDPKRFREITRGGDVKQVFAGIKAAHLAGLEPIKLNCVIRESSNEKDAQAVAAWGKKRGYEVRFIRRMDLNEGSFSIVEGGSGGDCARCNRLRLTADGFIRPCLFSDRKVYVRELGPQRALTEAVRCKPVSGGPNHSKWMHSIGG